MIGTKEVSFAFLLDDEGPGVRYHTGDPTAWGVSLGRLGTYRGTGVTVVELNELSRSEALQCLQDAWWDNALDLAPSGLDYYLLDSGLMCGFSNAYRWLELSVFSRDSGREHENVLRTVSDFSPERLQLLISQLTFSRRRRHKVEPGWLRYQQQRTNRVNRVQRRALKLTGGSILPVQPKEELAHVG